MKVIKPPNEYDIDLYCDNNMTKLKSDCIVEECKQCPFCGATTIRHRTMKEMKWSFFGNYKGDELYAECVCKKCGAKWESNRYFMHNDDSCRVAFIDVCNKLNELLGVSL